MIIKYKLTFYDYWHLSSGISAGAKLDSLVVKDKDDIVYASGKTIKGMAREMAENLENKSFVQDCFGNEDGNLNKCYFSNATIKNKEKSEIVSHKLQNNLYDVIASTSIDSNGVSINNSLREIEVVIPISLYGEILDVPETYTKEMEMSLKLIKRMGLNRNRGLGRCAFEIEEIK